MAPVPANKERQENMTARDENASVVINVTDKQLHDDCLTEPRMPPSTNQQYRKFPHPQPVVRNDFTEPQMPPSTNQQYRKFPHPKPVVRNHLTGPRMPPSTNQQYRKFPHPEPVVRNHFTGPRMPPSTNQQYRKWPHQIQQDELPSPKKQVELPSPKKQVELPSPIKQVELPSPIKQVELPSPIKQDGMDELPSPKKQVELPSPIKQDELPTPIKQDGMDELPSPKKQVELPSPKKQVELPSPIKQDELPSPPIKDETLPLPANSEDDDDFDELLSLLCSQSGTDLLSEVALKLYVDLSNNSFGAREQEGLTCYANAIAAVLHLAMKRIVGRDGGHPDFCTLREEIIQEYGWNGANSFNVLQEVCPRYRLHFQEVNTQGALSAVAERRPVIANFYLTFDEWRAFGVFFEDNPTGTLSEKEVDIKKRKPDMELEGHSVVLTSFNSGSLRFMNSWGPDWGDKGFFNVESTDVLGFDYCDIFWTLDDLSVEEKAKYEKRKKKLKDILANGQGQHRAYFTRRSPPSPRKR